MASAGAVPAPDPTAPLVGQSPAMHALRTQIRHLARFDTLGNAAAPTVLLYGETGTGKGLVAQVLHASGPRARGPFVEVNCAAIPETLLEAELFGFEAGAFSEARRAKPGLLEAASGGSLFLDEIDTLPGLLQGKLLTVLEAKRVRRLGAVVEHAVDVKVLAATQVALSEHVAVGRFRADLYHRLAVVVLDLPPLRARSEDILELAQTFLQRYAAVHGLPPKRLSAAAEGWLRGYDWPGNVRELSHLMERVTLLSAEPTLTRETLERLGLPRVGPNALQAPGPLPRASEPLDEAARIQQALEATRGNVVQAARQLGLSRSGLRYRMQRYGLEPPRARGTRRGTRHRSHSVPVTQDQGGTPCGDLPVPASSWEQKLVAVLAIDLTFPQSTGLEAIDYEPWTVASRWEATLLEKVQGFGGHLLQRVASLYVIAFGLSQGPEQLPQRAVQAALAIRQGVAEAQGCVGQAPVPVVRQALHLGPLLVEEVGHAAATQYLAVGETVSLPLRLLGHAAPGEILVTAQVGRRLAGWCTLEARQLAVAPGHAVQEGVYSVLGLISRRAPLAGLGARLLSQFVGRERELATLHALLGQVQAGRGQVVRLVGEPGVGKTRLLDEFRRNLIGQQVTYLEGRCLSYGTAIPYGAVLDLLRDNCGLSETDSPEAITEKVRGSLQEVGMDAEAGTPYLLHLLGVTSRTEFLADVSPETLKARTFETLLQMSLRGSQQRPLILTVEDMQWIDQTSQDFLTTMVEGLAGLPILLLVTCRPGLQPPWLEKSYATQMVLPPLTPQESLCLVQALLQTALVPASLVQFLLAKAEGNPFFLEELVQALVEQGVVVRTPEGGMTLAEPWLHRPLTAIQVPPTVQGVLAARIDQLPAAAKELLQTLAVIGRTFSFRLVTQVVESPKAALHRLLVQLQGAEFLYERPAWPEAEYTFKHALTQEVAYTAVPSMRHRALHERTAQAIEALFPTRLEEHYGELAHHYSRSGNTAKALDYLQRAGHQAVQRSAPVEAISHFTTALELLITLPDTPERTQRELVLQTMLGPALMNSKGFAAPDVEHVYARARELCQQVGDTSQLFPVLRGLWVFYFVRGKHETAKEIAEELLALAQEQHDADLLLEAARAVGCTLFYLGEFAAARAHLEQGIALYDPQQHCAHTFLYGEDPGVGCRAFAARALWSLGYPEQALQRSREALTLARELAQPFSLVQAQSFATWTHQFRREVLLTQQYAETTMTVATDLGFPAWVGQGLILGGWALAVQGHGAAGIAQIHQGLSARQATGADLARSYWLALLAEVHGEVGQAEEGLSVLAEAFAEVRKTGERWWEAELYRLKGELLLQQALGKETSRVGPTTLSPVPEAERPLDTEAEAAFRQALDTARCQQAKSLELRAAVSLSRLWQCQGKRTEACALLAPVYAWFTEGFDTADLQEAKALLEELGR
jgi:DNA-binding NtrC family response regulator/predicted ATPase/class 3 adenylate cyclase